MKLCHFKETNEKETKVQACTMRGMNMLPKLVQVMYASITGMNNYNNNQSCRRHLKRQINVMQRGDITSIST